MLITDNTTFDTILSSGFSSFVFSHMPRIISSLFSPRSPRLPLHEGVPMQSKDVEEIKAALWEQVFLGCTQVRCPIGQVMAI